MLTRIFTHEVRSQFIALLAALFAFQSRRKRHLVPVKIRALPAPVIDLSINKEP